MDLGGVRMMVFVGVLGVWVWFLVFSQWEKGHIKVLFGDVILVLVKHLLEREIKRHAGGIWYLVAHLFWEGK